MKGNETRVVIFLQPVNPSNEGQVSTLKQSKWMFSPFLLLLVLGTLLGLGMFGYVLFTILNSDLDATTATTNNFDLATMTTGMTTVKNTTASINTEPTTMAIKTTLKTTAEITIPTATTIIPSRQIYNY